jgi:hypothetical protein
MQKSSIKYSQIKSNYTFKMSYVMIVLVSFQGYKDGSSYANQ